MDVVIETGYYYKNNSVKLKHRTFDTLNAMIDTMLRNANERRGEVDAMKASLNAWTIKMADGTLTDPMRIQWCAAVTILSYLGAIPCDDANGTMTIITQASNPCVLLENLETQPLSMRSGLLETAYQVMCTTEQKRVLMFYS